MTSLIIGLGEVGLALKKILNCVGFDPNVCNDDTIICPVDIIHICFPYSDNFNKEVRAYQKQYTPKYTVIHSTVPVGTCRRLKAHHSPVRGVHPHLQEGILTFPKWLAPKSKVLKKYFEDCGINVFETDKTETTEAAKIWCTTYYGWNIIIEKQIFEYCKKHKLPFEEVYTEWNNQYNWGYTQLDMENVVRPILKHIKGKIGGHCVTSNLKFLNNEVSNIINKLNK